MTVPSGATPPELLLPTYQNRLRVIGRQLDLGGYGAINLLEVPGGSLVRAMGPGARAPEALEFPLSEVPVMLAEAIAGRGEGARDHRPHPLLPTGYEDFLRALGHRLDAQQSEAITVAELEGFIAVGGLTRVEEYARTGIAPFQLLLRAGDIIALLDEAFRRRAPDAAARPNRRFGFARGTG